MKVSSPQPAVLHLVTLFRQITSGEIRIPAFQRAFVWKERQIVELLDSVLNGYPIGSLLLWGVDKEMLKIAPPEVTAFPALPERFPTNYVLDGMQRLSTLYGAFNFGSSTNDERFNVVFDLDQSVFSQVGNGDVGEAAVPLSALFVPRQLLEHQARLAKHTNGDWLIEKLLQLQAAFQDYMVPVVTIKSDDVSRIVGIFEKINSTGTRLDPVDFMRAITWAEEFDLNHYLDSAAQELSERGFELPPETIVKCVGMTLGIPPTTDGLLALRGHTPDELRGAFAQAVDSLLKTIDFLAATLQIRSYDFVPYEGQLLLLFRTIGMGEADGNEVDAIIKWFWASGFNELLRGKPDHYVVRAVENWRTLVSGGIRGLEPRLRLDDQDLVQRRLVSGAALTSTFVTMHAEVGAKSFASGAIIPAESYMRVANPNWFEPIFSRAELKNDGIENVSARLFANVVLMDEDTRRQFGGNAREAILSAAASGGKQALSSQFIDDDVLSCIRSGDVGTALVMRSYLIHDRARQLIGDEP